MESSLGPSLYGDILPVWSWSLKLEESTCWANTNSKGDRGSPWRTPMNEWILPVTSALIRIDTKYYICYGRLDPTNQPKTQKLLLLEVGTSVLIDHTLWPYQTEKPHPFRAPFDLNPEPTLAHVQYGGKYSAHERSQLVLCLQYQQS